MAKYNYDKSALKGLGVGAFLNEVKVREAQIAKAPAEEIQSEFNSNILAAKLHPHVQCAKVSKVTELNGAKTFTLVPDPEKGTKALAYFRAGQYVSIVVSADGILRTRPYTLACAPKSALGEENTSYQITVKGSPNGVVSSAMLENWKEGTEVMLSGPLGYFYYQKLRDAAHVVACAGGSGITPFLSMAEAIADGTEDFRLTILYGNRTEETILLKEQLEEAEKRSGGKVKVVHILSEEEKEGYEHGFISAEIIKKYAGDGDYSIFACGPKAMYTFLDGEIKKLGLPKRRARFEVPGEYGDPSADPSYPKEAAGKEYTVKIIARGRLYEVSCRADQTLLSAAEEAGIFVTGDCRSGVCGWCHSRLIEGDVFMPEDADGRRKADKKFGWIHPCVSYPVSDCAIEVFPTA